MTPIVAAAFLVAYYLLSIEIYLATYCVGRFQMSFWGWGPTELRILLAIGALTLLVKPMVTIFGLQMRLFDVGGLIGAAGLVFTAIISAIGNTRKLYTAEPLPQNSVSQRKDARDAEHGTRGTKAAVFSADCVSELCGYASILLPYAAHGIDAQRCASALKIARISAAVDQCMPLCPLRFFTTSPITPFASPKSMSVLSAK